MSVPVPAPAAIALACIAGFVCLIVWSVLDRNRK